MVATGLFTLLFPLPLLWLLSCWWLRRHRGARWRLGSGRRLFADGPALRREENATRALFVTAHPDDEAMFFAPTILSLAQARLWLLCGSTGNYYSQGDVRKKELLDSCLVLGIPPSNVTVIDHRDLPDHPSVEWDTQLLSALILKHVKTNQINLVVTFDARGVSGHLNHKCLYTAVRRLHSEKKFPEGVYHCLFIIYYRGDIPYNFKHLLPFGDIPNGTCATSPNSRRAMQCHHSQLLWFRRLYLFFSRYVVINSLRSL
nr:N-acetylglucosaminyl-phosphatidylinositol de-N-acetylase [Zootoca vivipara]